MLRDTLRSAVASRRLTLKHGWCRRTDHDQLATSLRITEEFLRGMPTDALVLQWCRDNAGHLKRVVPANQRRRLEDLFGVK